MGLYPPESNSTFAVTARGIPRDASVGPSAPQSACPICLSLPARRAIVLRDAQEVLAWICDVCGAPRERWSSE